MMMRLTIGRRLAIGFGLVLAMMLAVTVVGIGKVAFIDTTLTRITDLNGVKQRHAINFRGSVHDRAISLRDVTLVSSQADLDAAIADIERLAAFYAKSAGPLDEIMSNQSDRDPKEQAILDSIKEIEKHTLPLIDQVIQARKAGHEEEARALLLKDAAPAFTVWLARINQFIDFQEANSQQETVQVRAEASGFARLMIILNGIALVAGVGVAFWITRYLRSTLGGEPEDAVGVVTRIAGGDLTSRVETAYPDSMLGAVDRMQERLKLIFSTVIHSAADLNRRAERVAEASTNAQQAAQRQVESAIATVDSLNMMTESIHGVSDVAIATESNSELTSKLSEEGTHVVESAVKEIERIEQTVSLSSQQIVQLSERSQEIGGIAGVIKEIAGQTNLLALNAAIEAARAGESGRGFAVVADEVRKLAERTSTATVEIARMLEIIQRDTQSAVEAMGTAAPQIQKGLKLSTEATVVLGQIRDQANSSLQNAREVAGATGQQTESVSMIAHRVEEIATVSRETNKVMEDAVTASQELESIAETLREHVSHFRVA